MATFKKTMSGDDRYYIELSVSEVSGSVNVSDNTSQISYTLTATKKSGTGYHTTNTNNPYKVTIDGVEVRDSSRAYDFTGSTPKTITLASGTRTITHNDDGKKTISCKGYFKDANNSLGSATASGSLTLSNIPRATEMIISEGHLTLGTAVNIGLDRASNDFKDTLSYSFGNASGVIATNITASSYTWTPPITLAQQIPNQNKLYMSITCETYNGDTLIGTHIFSIEAHVPDSLTPSISVSTPTLVTSEYPTNWNMFIVGKSKASYTITGTGNQGSTISTYQSSVDGYSYTTPSVTTNTLTSLGTNYISAKVTDSRGKSAVLNTTNFYVYDYQTPTIKTAEIQRCDVNGNIDKNGQYCFVTFWASVTDLNGYNSSPSIYQISYRVHETGDYSQPITASWGVENCYKTGMLYTDGIYPANRGSGTKVQIPTTNTYDIKFTARDYFTETQSIQVLDTGFDLMNFNASGKAMAIGKVSEASSNEEKLEIALPTNISEDVTMSNGAKIVDYVKNTDYATDTTAGVMKGNVNGFLVSSSSGNPSANTYTYAQYGSLPHYQFVGKGTLENVLDGYHLKSYVLYDGSASALTITLTNDSFANYTYIDIYYEFSSNNGVMFSRVYNPNGKVVNLTGLYDNNTNGFFAFCPYTISGNKMTRGTEIRWRWVSTGGANQRTTGTENIQIFRIEGYK